LSASVAGAAGGNDSLSISVAPLGASAYAPRPDSSTAAISMKASLPVE
jgi:hypothetical protein